MSALAVAGLCLVGEGVRTADLVDRFAAEGVPIQADRAEAVLAELAGMGLTRVARASPEGQVHVLTVLGERAVGAVMAFRTEQAAQLEELESLRTDLLSTIAHELRTPLTAVRTSVGILRDPATAPDADQRARLLATIERNADRMQRLVGDILDLTRFRAGRIQLQLRRFDAADMTRSAVASFPDADERFEVSLPGHRVALYGDRRRLEQALVNLLSNARKYSPHETPGAVTVEADGDAIQWRVADRGTGIPPSDLPRLFERFFVGRNDRSGSRDGVGLGLPIALAIAQAHGGRIEVQSEPGHGSTFTMAVPVAGPRDGDE